MENKRFYSDLIIVITTEVDCAVADTLAKERLSRRLVACANLREIKSYFNWEGKLEEVNEVQLFMKTSKYQLNNLLDAINQLHSYQIPELIYWPASSNDSYREWVENSILPLD